MLYPYSKPEILKEDIDVVNRVLKDGYLTQGKQLEKFQIKISKEFNCNHSIVCNSGTAALHLLYNAIGLSSSAGLLTSPITFLSTANAARMCDAPVFFADVDPKTGLLTPETVERALKKYIKKIKVICVVHLGGKVCDVKNIAKVAKKYDCVLVEDASHAPGALYPSMIKEKFLVGSCKYSIGSIFSFHAIKHIATGEGGCVTTNDDRVAKKIIDTRNHGMIRDHERLKHIPEKNASWYYEMNEIGWNYRLDEISCALGISQIDRLKNGISKRRELAIIYYNELIDIKYITLPSEPQKIKESVWHLYPVLIDFDKLGVSRGNFMKKLSGFGIGSQVHYIPLFMQPYYKNNSFINFKGAMNYYNSTLSLPLYPSLVKEDLIFICSKIKEIVNSL